MSSNPQGLILGPLLFNHGGDLFLVINNIDLAKKNQKNIDLASHVDENTPYTIDESAKKFMDKLETEAKSLFKWFRKPNESQSR